MKQKRKLKRPKTPPKLVLGHAIGLTTKNANGFDWNQSTSNCVYTAGCVLVVYNLVSGFQSSFMVPNRTPKLLSCTAMSKDGRFVAAGELEDPAAVLVWDYTSSMLLFELKSHQDGVECISFSPDGKYLVSVGVPNDGYICLWDSTSGVLVARLKACLSCSSSVESICFSSDSNFIVTAGKKHLKLWKVISLPRTRANLGVKSKKLHGKPVNLRNQKGSSFAAVKFSTFAHNNLANVGQTGETLSLYGLTDSGVLSLISGSSIRKSVDVKVKKAFALSVSDKMVACACNNGVVKLFTTESLSYCGSLMHKDWRKCEGDDNDYHGEYHEKDLMLLAPIPHAIACEFLTSEKLVVLYGDNSIYAWDICDLEKVTGHEILVSHSGSICDIKGIPCKNGTSFATCSEAGTIRLWNILQTVSSASDQTLVTNSNSISTKPVIPVYKVNSEIFEPESEKQGVHAPGYCSIAISSDGKYLAVSDVAIDSTTEVVVTPGQDKKLDIFSSDTGKLVRSFKHVGDFGDVIKVTVDQSSSFVVCSYSNKSICIYDLLTGEIAAQAFGHGEVITSLVFSPDFQHIVSASDDGCIFIWRLPVAISSKILQKIEKNSRLSSCMQTNLQPEVESCKDAYEFELNSKEVKQIESISTPVTQRFSCQGVGLREMSVFKFSISRLPKWAQTRAINLGGHPVCDTSQEVGNHYCSDEQTSSECEQKCENLLLDDISAFSSVPSPCQGSRLAQGDHRMSFALDGRWLSIYTVCLDSPNSPAISSNIKLHDMDKLNHNSSSQSAQSETEKLNLLAKRSSSTLCALRNDHRGQKNLNHQPIRISIGEDMVQPPQDLQLLGDMCFLSQSELGKCEEQKAIISCKESFHNMERAIDNAYHLFSKFKNLAIKEDLRESESGLYSQVSEMLPSLAMKFHAITQMVKTPREN